MKKRLSLLCLIITSLLISCSTPLSPILLDPFQYEEQIVEVLKASPNSTTLKLDNGEQVEVYSNYVCYWKKGINSIGLSENWRRCTTNLEGLTYTGTLTIEDEYFSDLLLVIDNQSQLTPTERDLVVNQYWEQFIVSTQNTNHKVTLSQSYLDGTSTNNKCQTMGHWSPILNWLPSPDFCKEKFGRNTWHFQDPVIVRYNEPARASQLNCEQEFLDRRYYIYQIIIGAVFDIPKPFEHYDETTKIGILDRKTGGYHYISVPTKSWIAFPNPDHEEWVDPPIDWFQIETDCIVP